MPLFRSTIRQEKESAAKTKVGLPTPFEAVYSLVPGGAPVLLVDGDPSLRDRYPEWGLQTKRWFAETAQPDWVVLDVGADVGIYAILAASLAKSGVVHAFEPARTIDAMRRNVDASGLTNIHLHPLKIDDRTGVFKAPLYGIWGRMPEAQSYEFTTMDNFVAASGIERIDCIRVNLGSHDLGTLHGAIATLQRFDPWLLIELPDNGQVSGFSVAAAFRWLLGQGYRSAFVMDEGTYVLRREIKTTKLAVRSPTRTLNLDFDRRPIFLIPTFAPGKKISEAFTNEPLLHNQATFESSGGVRVFWSPGPQWGIVASFEVTAELKTTGTLLVDIVVEILEGTLGVGFMNSALSRFLSKESSAAMAVGPQRLRVVGLETAEIRHLALRNLSGSGALRVRLLAVEFSVGVPAVPARVALMEPSRTTVDLGEEWAALTGTVVKPSGSISAGRSLRIVGVEDLGEALGFSVPFIPEKAVYRYGIADFKTEVDETGIYQYLYREFAPRRHLEFGTWEGWGATVCAGACEAEIWTINLSDGERDTRGQPKYATTETPSDSGSLIGWRYREAGYGSRVHQILCDSRDFSVDQFGVGFFDSVLIDGGHTAEVVISDTEKALASVRSGGLIIWHDFCPDSSVLRGSEAGRGVFSAVHDNLPTWRTQLKDIFWVRPSWLLIGIKS